MTESVLRVETPVLLKSDQQPLDSREVLRLLHRGASAALRLARSGAEVDEFAESAGLGVSANLCLALGDIGGGKRPQSVPFELRFDWSSVGNPPTAAPLRFDQSDVAVIRRAGEALRERVFSEDATVSGRVVGLERVSRGGRGSAVVEALVTTAAGTFRERIKVALEPAQYLLSWRCARTSRNGPPSPGSPAACPWR